jgi:hypothetical protein
MRSGRLSFWRILEKDKTMMKIILNVI